MDDNEQKILDFLKANTVATGSRYWSSVDPELIQVTELSDYDFVVSEDDPVVTKAIELAQSFGVNIKRYSDYDLDPSTHSVICFGVYTQLIIKFSNWYDSYLMFQSLCTPTFYHNFLWKKNGIEVPLVRDRLIMMMSFFMNDLKVVKNTTEIVDNSILDQILGKLDQLHDTIQSSTPNQETSCLTQKPSSSSPHSEFVSSLLRMK